MLLIQLLHELDICEVLPILWYVTIHATCVRERNCVHKAVLYFCM